MKLLKTSIALTVLLSTASGAAFADDIVTFQKRNTGFSLDGNRGAIVGQRVYLFDTNNNNVNQQWVELERDNGFVSYQKRNTSLCMDGGDAGRRRQEVTLEQCNSDDRNQHWELIDQAAGHVRIKKRDFSFSIDGMNGGERLQNTHLWSSGDSNVNQHWVRNVVGTTGGSSTPTPTPTPSGDGDFDLNPNADPWDNFDLSVWGLDSPALRDTSLRSGEDDFERGVRVDDFEFIALREGSSNSDFDDSEDLFFGREGNTESSDPYFFTASDGGMVFKSPVDGGRTSTNTRFPRSELREYVRAGQTRRSSGESISISGANENNWVLGYQPDNLILDDNNRGDRGIENVGGRNGVLTGTLRVNKVTETGRPDDIGVVIIGQIHAEDDEPMRLYYRKLPGNELGSVYFIHEINGDDDLDEVNLVGSRDDDASNPSGGIALDELFSYEIIAEGDEIEVVLRRGDSDGQVINRGTVNMSDEDSDYDRRDEWMYFKAGAYTQNNVAVERFRGEDLPGAATTGFGPNGNEADYDQVTFYRLNVSHDSNNCGQCSD